MTHTPYLRRLAGLALSVAGAMAMAAPPAAPAAAPTGATTSRYIVAVAGTEARWASPAGAHDDARARLSLQRLQRLGVQPLRSLERQAAWVADLTPAQAARVARDPSVAYVERDVMRKLMSEGMAEAAAPKAPAWMNGYTAPSKAPLTVGQRVPYAITAAQVPEVTGGDSQAGAIKVCVIDSGFDITNPDLAANIVTGNMDPKAGDWRNDEMGHGTHVAGVIVALNNATGIVGVLPGGRVQLHIVKVYSKDAWVYSSDLLDAADKCAAAGSKVISMSLGAPGSQSKTEEAGLNRIAASGVLLVAAAGNEGTKAVSYPAGYASVVAVGAVDNKLKRASYSQYNSTVEWAAGGSDVLSTYPVGRGGAPSLSVAGQPMTPPRWALHGANNVSVTAPLADFGTGAKVDKAMTGKICVASRTGKDTDVSYVATNCNASGGVGLIVGNTGAGSLTGTLYLLPKPLALPVVTVDNKQYATLKTKFGSTATLAVVPADHTYMNGTSFATPLASGVAALVWSHAPQCTAAQIRAVIGTTAKDLGPAGRDPEYGFGLVQAKAAVDRIAAQGCGA